MSADSHNTLTGLQSDLEAAVSAEDYLTAAKLRDELTYASYSSGRITCLDAQCIVDAAVL